MKPAELVKTAVFLISVEARAKISSIDTYSKMLNSVNIVKIKLFSLFFNSKSLVSLANFLLS